MPAAPAARNDQLTPIAPTVNRITNHLPLDALSVRLEATKPAELRRPDQPHPEEETEA